MSTANQGQPLIPKPPAPSLTQVPGFRGKRSVITATVETQIARPLTSNQKRALNQFGRKWKQCPPLIHVSTLMSLLNRKLIECRVNGPYVSGISDSYKGFLYEWRKAPSDPNGNENQPAAQDSPKSSAAILNQGRTKNAVEERE